MHSIYYIFGASGFIGTHLVNAIRQKDSDSLIYNFDTVKNDHNGQSRFLHCDVREPISFDLPADRDAILINLAAVHRTPGHPDREYFETNVRGAENICAFAEQCGITAIVFTSSISSYGTSEDKKTEDSLPMPNTAYGMSKWAAEQIHRIWQAKQPGRKLLILRPGVVFGQGENGNFTRLYWGLRKRIFAYVGRKDTIKASIYVKDLADFMLHETAQMTAGVELYNCSYEPAPAIEQTVEAIKKVTGMKRRVWQINGKLLMLTAAVIAPIGGKKLGIHPERIRKLLISTNICGKKMAASSYRFRFSFEEAIADWYADNHHQSLQ